jgi:HK97 family phage major capsid protein
MAKKKAARPSASFDSRAPAEFWLATRSPGVAAMPGSDVSYREMSIAVDAERARDEGDARTPIAISSETPVERYDWWEDERFLEVLDHSTEAIDLSYARDGLPFLVGHDSRDMVGLVEDVQIGKDGLLRGMVKFSRSQRAQEIEQDIRDGIRKKISVGYTYEREHITRQQKSPKELPTVTLHRWKPLEASSVPIPADYNVGVGRSAELVAARSLHLSSKRNAAPQAEEPTMAENANAVPAENGAAQITAVRDANDARMKDVAEMSAMLKMEGVFAAGMAAGKSPEDIRADLKSEQARRLAAGEQAIQNGGGPGVVQLTEREQRQYSLTRAINAAAGEGEAGFEMEVSNEIGRKIGRQSSKGFYFPTTVGHGQRAGLYNAATVGAETVFDVPGSFIDLLRKKARVLQAGATMLSGLQGPVTFPKQTAAGTAYWMPENGGTDVTDSNLVLGTVTLVPLTIQSSSSFSRQLLRQSTIDVEGLVRADLAAIHALAIDLAALNGSGSGQPLGIIQNTNCNTVALGTHGAAPTYTAMVQMEEEVEKDDADTGTGAYITTPSVKRKLKTTQIFTSEGVAIWSGGPTGTVNGYTAYSTNQVPNNLTKGTSTTVCHGIVFGHWANLLIGEWGAMEIIVDPFSLKKQGMIEITSFQMADVDVKYAQAFCVVSDALPG